MVTDDVRIKLRIVACGLMEAGDGGLFSDEVRMARELRWARTELSRLIREVESKPGVGVAVHAAEGGVV